MQKTSLKVACEQLARPSKTLVLALALHTSLQFVLAQTTTNPDTRELTDVSPVPYALAAQESKLRDYLASHPTSAPTLYELALVLRQENKPKESLETYTRAAQHQKPDADQLRSVALDYVLLSDYPDAIHWLETARSFDPTNVDVLYSLARCYYTQNQYREAEAVYLRILQLKPDHLKAEENLGLTYDAENQPEQAEAALRKAADWASGDKTDVWPFLDLGSFLLAHDRAKEAVPFLQSAVTIDPKCAACHEKLGRSLEETGRVSEGVKELETAVQLDPKNPNVHFELGHAYRQAGSLDKARAEYAISEQLRHQRDRQQD